MRILTSEISESDRRLGALAPGGEHVVELTWPGAA